MKLIFLGINCKGDVIDTIKDLNFLSVIRKVLGHADVKLLLVGALSHVPNRVVVNLHLTAAISSDPEQGQSGDKNQDLEELKTSSMCTDYFTSSLITLTGVLNRYLATYLSKKILPKSF